MIEHTRYLIHLDFLDKKQPEALSLGIKSLDYLHLIEPKNDQLLPANVDDVIDLSLFNDPYINIIETDDDDTDDSDTEETDAIYTEETDNSWNYSDPTHNNLGTYFEDRKRFFRWLSMNGLETGNLFEAITYDYRFDLFPRYNGSYMPLKLGAEDLKHLLSKKTSLELRAWGGHLFKEFRLKILNSKNKAQAFSTVLKVIEKCGYCKYHKQHVVGNQLEMYLGLLDMLNIRGEMPTYSRTVVQLLQLFTHHRKVLKLLFRKRFPIDVRTFVNASRQEKFPFFNLWTNSINESSEYLTDLALWYSITNTETLLLKGGTSSYTDEGYRVFQKYTGETIEFSVSSKCFEKFMENIAMVKKSNRIKYRCLQAVYIHNDRNDSFHPCGKPRRTSLLRLIWKNISEPFLTEDDFMSLSVTEENSSTDNNFKKVWNWYTSSIGKENITQGQTPRTLYDISAVVIRKELAKCYNFPDGILELSLPRHIKKYLYLSIQEDDMSVIPN